MVLLTPIAPPHREFSQGSCVFIGPALEEMRGALHDERRGNPYFQGAPHMKM